MLLLSYAANTSFLYLALPDFIVTFQQMVYILNS